MDDSADMKLVQTSKNNQKCINKKRSCEKQLEMCKGVAKLWSYISLGIIFVAPRWVVPLLGFSKEEHRRKNDECL